MGHDITAIKDKEEYNKFWDNYKGENVPRDKLEVSYLRRNMFSESIKFFYDYLGCYSFYAGVSGNGEDAEVTLKQLKAALLQFKNKAELFVGDDYKDYTEFIVDCIEFCKENNKDKSVIRFG